MYCVWTALALLGYKGLRRLPIRFLITILNTYLISRTQLCLSNPQILKSSKCGLRGRGVGPSLVSLPYFTLVETAVLVLEEWLLTLSSEYLTYLTL